MSDVLSADAISQAIQDLPGWSVVDDQLRAVVEAPTFVDAIRIVDAVALVAEEMDHHPDLDIRWRTVNVALSTHSAGGITALDVDAAHRISAIAEEHQAHLGS
jgi:4a-hydroxytetrahydrobiopterin dehydratase